MKGSTKAIQPRRTLSHAVAIARAPAIEAAAKLASATGGEIIDSRPK